MGLATPRELGSTPATGMAAVTDLFEPQHPHTEDVFISTGEPEGIPLADELLRQQQLLHPALRDVGSVAIIGRNHTKEHSKDKFTREHLLLTADIEDFRHRLWMTEPKESTQDPLLVVTKPGLGELIEDGIGFEFHREIARQLPGAFVVSHATHGVGPTADRIPLRELPQHGLDAMAEQCLKLLQTYFEGMRTVYVGTSMGTVIGNKLLRLNLESDSPVNIEGVVHIAPALVPPEHVVNDMVFKFGPTIARDIFKQLTFKTSPKHIVGTLRQLVKSKPSMRDIPPFVRQIFDLLQGTPEEEIDQVLEAYAVSVITGSEDSVGGFSDLWVPKADQFPNLTLDVVKGRGHDIATDPVRAGKKVSKSIVNRGWYDQATDKVA